MNPLTLHACRELCTGSYYSNKARAWYAPLRPSLAIRRHLWCVSLTRHPKGSLPPVVSRVRLTLRHRLEGQEAGEGVTRTCRVDLHDGGMSRLVVQPAAGTEGRGYKVDRFDQDLRGLSLPARLQVHELPSRSTCSTGRQSQLKHRRLRQRSSRIESNACRAHNPPQGAGLPLCRQALW